MQVVIVLTREHILIGKVACTQKTTTRVECRFESYCSHEAESCSDDVSVAEHLTENENAEKRLATEGWVAT